MNDKLNRRLLIIAKECIDKNYSFHFMTGMKKLCVSLPNMHLEISLTEPDWDMLDLLLQRLSEAPCLTN